jgi:hypothetical protein
MIDEPQPYVAFMPRCPNFELFDISKKLSKITYQAEYEMVKRGYRDANIYHLMSNDYDNQIEQVFKDGLTFRPIRRVKQYNGFSHKHVPSKDLGPDTMVFGVVARDWDIATEFKNADLGIDRGNKCDHAQIGEYLGYPECCTDFFAKNFPESLDLVYESANNMIHNVDEDGAILLQDFNPLLQVHMRYFGLKVIPWFPCRYDCEESEKKAKQWFEVIKDLDSNLANKLLEMLAKPSSWDLNLAQILVEHPDFLGYCTSYYTEKKRIIKFNPRGE